MRPALILIRSGRMPAVPSHSYTTSTDSFDGANVEATWLGVQCCPENASSEIQHMQRYMIEYEP
jgi:hypothetical protein